MELAAVGSVWLTSPSLLKIRLHDAGLNRDPQAPQRRPASIRQRRRKKKCIVPGAGLFVDKSAQVQAAEPPPQTPGKKLMWPERPVNTPLYHGR